MKKIWVLSCMVTLFFTACSTNNSNEQIGITAEKNNIRITISQELESALIDNLNKGFSSTISIRISPLEEKNSNLPIERKSVSYTKTIKYYEMYEEYRIITGQTSRIYKDKKKAVLDFLSFSNLATVAENNLKITVRLDLINFKGVFSIIPDILKREAVYRTEILLIGEP
ncbi:hypothetical protein WKV44_01830 [Spirochaetia bacterium 38H-sp]|uniref:Lipoprotein n=1 Tax=Rarispira pelagica TaxID=3141764 RepID=A0ABU9U9E2_9SPIR